MLFSTNSTKFCWNNNSAVFIYSDKYKRKFLEMKVKFVIIAIIIKFSSLSLHERVSLDSYSVGINSLLGNCWL